MNLKYIYWIALGAIFFTACRTDLLDPVPQTSFSDLSVFDTPDRVESQANGLYASVKIGAYLGGRYFVYNDIRAENFLNRTTNGVTGLETWNHNVNASTNEVNNLWNAAYLAINRCNVFLAGIDANESRLLTAGLSQAQINAYRGEARFLRGMTYYHLLQLYARPFSENGGSSDGLPLRLTAETAAGANDLARSSVAQVYTQILSDLDFAETNLPQTRSNPFNNTVRAHRNTAIAFKTRVYLTMNRYQDVITEANKIVSATAPFTAGTGVTHSLQDNVSAVFAPPYTTTESILSMPFTENNLPGTQNGLGSYYNPGPRGIGDYSLNDATGILANSGWAEDDVRRQLWVFPAGGFVYLNKFPVGPQHLDYAPVIRYAEVLLNLAEARAKTSGVDDQAVALLNAVRGRSYPAGVYSAGDFANGQALVDAILLERNIEFIGEGHRSVDLLRNQLVIPGKGTVSAVQPSAAQYIWPIPIGELTVNKACTQNPGF